MRYMIRVLVLAAALGGAVWLLSPTEKPWCPSGLGLGAPTAPEYGGDPALFSCE